VPLYGADGPFAVDDRLSFGHFTDKPLSFPGERNDAWRRPVTVFIGYDDRFPAFNHGNAAVRRTQVYSYSYTHDISSFPSIAEHQAISIYTDLRFLIETAAAFGALNAYGLSSFGLYDTDNGFAMRAFIIFMGFSFEPHVFIQPVFLPCPAFDIKVFLPFRLPIVYVFRECPKP